MSRTVLTSRLQIGLLVLTLAGCTSRPELPPKAPEALVFSRTTEFRHDNIEAGVAALMEAGRDRGIRIIATEDPTRFNDAELSRYRAVVFFNTTGDVLDDTHQLAFERYIQSGGGFVGIHSAADTEWRGNQWPWYTRLVGAAFLAHPNTPSNVQEARLEVVDGDHPSTAPLGESWTRQDEWYDFQRSNPNVKPLLEVDEESYEGGLTGDPHPIAWFHEFDGGRSFYTGLGHTAESFEEDAFLEHVLGGLQWAMGGGHGPPDLDASRARPEDWRLVSEVLAEGIGEPIAMAFTPTGALYVIERRGTIRRWDQGTRELLPISQLDVYAESENGLAGIAFDPAYESNGWVYLYWASESDAASMPAYRLARYSLREADLDLASERVLLEVPIDRGMTSHEGGSLQFDSMGNLWISTGDDTNPHQAEGYAPLDQRKGRTIYDAARSAANSQDLRGKILRIRPVADGTYEIPDGNLFTEEADGRPEIYAMGVRNPYRFSVDSEKGVLYWGDVGPDAREDSPTRGPKGYDEVNRTAGPGNFGWPYVIGENLPYASYDWQTGESGAFFVPDAPRNDSVRNGGLRELPPARPAWIAYSYDDAGSLYDLESGSKKSSRTALVGPVFHSSQYEESAESLPRYYDGKLFLFDFMRDWIKLVSMQDDGTIRKIEPFPIELELVAPIDVKLGPDGALYVLEYGSSWFQENNDSRLSRTSYFAGDNPLPAARASVEPTLGAAPLLVALDGASSFDRNPDDELSYEWVLRASDGSERALARGVAAQAQIEQPGFYEVELRVSDTGGGKSSDTVSVVVGNGPPHVQLDLAGNQSFFFKDDDHLEYAVSVSDPEDGTTSDGRIEPSAVRVSIEYREAGLSPGEASRASRLALGSLDPAVADIQEFGCLSCHQPDGASAGPSFERIADRYRADPDVLRRLARKVVEGGSGMWGDRAMAAQPHVSETQAIRMVNYILLGSDGGVGGRPLRGRIEFDRHHESAVDSETFGSMVTGAYAIRASYSDQGGKGVGAITRQEERILRPARMRATAADRMQGAGSITVRPDLVPELIRGQLPEIPEDFAFLMARGGGHIVFEDVDLTGIDRLELTGAALSMFMAGGTVEARLDSPAGRLLGVAEITSTLLPNLLVEEVELGSAPGRHDLFLTFRNEGEGDGLLFALATIEFRRADRRARPDQASET